MMKFAIFSSTVVFPGFLQAQLVGQGSGSTSDLFEKTALSFFSAEVTYERTSSSEGRANVIDRDSDFCGTDVPFTDPEMASNSDLQVYPSVAVGVVPLFNIAGVTNITLSRAALADIFRGSISVWNDADIVSDNPSLSSVSNTITVVVRDDPSGENYVFTTALSSFDSTFASDIGSGESVDWASNIPAIRLVLVSSASQMVSVVMSTPFSIGYSTLNTAITKGMSYADMINSAGYKVSPSAASVTVALTDGIDELDSLMTADLHDSECPDAWPITCLTYFGVRKTAGGPSTSSCEDRQDLVSFLTWFYTSNAVKDIAGKLGYGLSYGFEDSIVPLLQKDILCPDSSSAGQWLEVDVSIIGLQEAQTVTDLTTSIFLEVDDILKSSFTPQSDMTSLWVDFSLGASVDIMSTHFLLDDLDLYTSEPLILTVPVHTVSVIPIFNIPQATEALVLSDDIMAQIYRGVISSWNDSSILLLNPDFNMSLLNHEILVAYISGDSLANQMLSYFLGSIDPVFKTDLLDGQSFVTDFVPSGSIPAGRLIQASGDDIDNLVEFNDWSIGYVLAHGQEVVSSIPTICTTTIGGLNAYCVDFVESSVLSCVDGTEVVNQEGEIVAYDLLQGGRENIGCWPMSATAQMSITRDFVSQDFTSYSYAGYDQCFAAEAIGAYVIWIAGDESAGNALRYVGTFPLSDAARLLAQYTIDDMTCDGTKVLARICGSEDYLLVLNDCDGNQRMFAEFKPKDENCVEVSSQPSGYIECDNVYFGSAVANTIIAMSVIAATIAFASAVWTIYYFRHDVVKLSQPYFLLGFQAGAVLFSCIPMMLLGKVSDESCLANMWYSVIASTCLIAPLIVKIRRVTLMVEKTKKYKKTKIHVWWVALQGFLLLLVDIAIMGLWTLVSPPHAESTTTSEGDLGDVPRVYCVTGSILFPSLLVFFKFSLCMLGVWYSYLAWGMHDGFAESKALSLSVYNIIILGISWLLLIYVLDTTVEERATMTSTFVFCTTIICVTVVMFHKIYHVHTNKPIKLSMTMFLPKLPVKMQRSVRHLIRPQQDSVGEIEMPNSPTLAAGDEIKLSGSHEPSTPLDQSAVREESFPTTMSSSHRHTNSREIS